MTTSLLGARFDDALVFASDLHRFQLRKLRPRGAPAAPGDGPGVPYVAHLLAVSAIVLEHGGDEDQAIAALLHDAIEDQAERAGGAAALRAMIGERFGAEVLRIVEACTDADTVPKPPWRARKEQYLAHLAGVDARAALVAAADKLHNVRSILSELRRIGLPVFERFSVSRAETLWYYGALAGVLRQLTLSAPQGRHPASFLVGELLRAIGELEQETAAAIDDSGAHR